MEVLAASVNGRRDKNDVLLQDLVNAKNWKQALTSCEKRIKKGEKHEILLVNKAHILLNTPDEERRKQGAADLYALLERKPPLANIDILMYIDKQAEIRDDQDSRIISMWERAAGGKPENEELYNRWFMLNFERKNYKAAQKAAMLYQKKFPEKRQPFFMTIVSSHLAATAPTALEIDKRIFGPLAYRLIAKAASDTVENLSASQKAVRVLGSAGDLHLLTTVYRSQGKYKEALDILNDDRIGLLSKIGANSWDLVREKISLCELNHSWEELWQFCRQLLLEAIDHDKECCENDSNKPGSLGFGKFGDDWTVWAAFIGAAAATTAETSEISVLTKKVIDCYLICGKASRHARLALVEYSCRVLGGVSSQQEDLLSSCQSYFECYSSTKVCFEDLHHCTHILDLPRQTSLLIYASDHAVKVSCSNDSLESNSSAWITSEINALKLDYTLVVSHQDTVTENMDLLEAFVSNCLRLYNVSLSLAPTLPVSERYPGDDAAILAAMGCIHMHANGNRSALLRSVFILEKLLLHSKHNYDAILIIVRIYLYLGASTRALEHYSKLDLKNIQFQTLAWIVLDRISTLHPHKSTKKAQGKPSFDPAYLLQAAVSWILRSEAQIRSSFSKYFENDSYINLIDQTISLERMQTSLVKCNFICGISRIARFRYTSGLEMSIHVLRPINSDSYDIKDLAAFPNYEAHDQRTFEEYTRSSPEPSMKLWLSWQYRVLQLSEILAGRPPHLAPSPSDDLFHWLEGEDAIGQTSHETELGIVASALLPLHSYTSMAIQEKQHDDSEKTAFSEAAVTNMKHLVENHAQKYLAFIVDRAKLMAEDPWPAIFTLTEDLRVPHWDFFHLCYCMLDMSRLIASTIICMAKINVSTKQLDQEWIEDRAEWCRAQCREVHVSLQRAAQMLQHLLGLANLVEEMKVVCYWSDGTRSEGDTIGVELRQMLDDSWVQDISKILVGSWEEALEGILGIEPEY